MKYLITINDDERRANDEDPSFNEVRDDVAELLRSGYYSVERVEMLDI